MTALSELLAEAKGDASVDTLIAEARRRGVEVADTARATIYDALKGEHAKRPREATLQLWADIFRLDVRSLRDAAGMPRGELGPWVPVAEAARLDQGQRDALDNLIKTIVREGGGADGDDAAPNTKRRVVDTRQRERSSTEDRGS